jgi:hypothetical protein
MAAGALLAAVFVITERRAERRGVLPLLDLRVLRSRGLPGGLAALSLSQICYGGVLFVFTLYMQVTRHETALRAGFSYLPFAVTFGLVSYYWRGLPARFHRVLAPAGLAATAVGYLLLPVTGPDGLALVGTGLGLAVSPLFNRALAHVLPDRAADASGVLTTTVQLSQLTGVAGIGSLYLSLAHHALPVSAYALTVLSLAAAAVAIPRKGL